MAPLLQVYVGTYTDKASKSKGIYSLKLDLAGGTLTPPHPVIEAQNPSFLAVHPTGRFLYAVEEIACFEGRKCGDVVALAIDHRSGQLALLNRRSTCGAGPCHVIVDPGGRNLLVANYAGGSVSVLSIRPDGTLSEASDVVPHAAWELDASRVKRPHAHSICLDPAGRFALVADLGLDKILVYRFDPAKGTLALHDPSVAHVAAGAGPRHLAMHPAGRFAYLVNEMASTVTAFAYDAARGCLRELQVLSTLPDAFRGKNTGADIHVHPSGKVLYCSNRGHDSIAVLAIDSAAGTLTLVNHFATRGRTPRGFAVDPTGTYLLAANQDSDTIVVSRIEPDTGTLVPTAFEACVPCPVCIKFVPVRE